MPAPAERDDLLMLLRRLTPMPPDARITIGILRAYNDVTGRIAGLEEPDPAFLRPLLDSLGPGEGKGAFERVLAFIERFPPEVSGPPLVAALEQGAPGPRKWAATALGRIAYAPARQALEVAVEDGDPAVRRAADLSLRMIEAAEPEGAGDEDEGYDPLFDGIAES